MIYNIAECMNLIGSNICAPFFEFEFKIGFRRDLKLDIKQKRYKDEIQI